MKIRVTFLLITICLICCFLIGCNDTTSDLDSNDNVEQNGNEDGMGDNVTDDTNQPDDNDNSSNIGDEDNANDQEDNGEIDNPDTGNDNTGDNTTPTICQHDNCTVIDYKEKSCEEDGYTGDLYCNDCKTVVRYGNKIDKIGHNYIAHFCDNCGDFLIIGKYLGDRVNSIVYDAYGQKDEYLEYKELSVLENEAQILSVKKNIKIDLLYYRVDELTNNCSIDYYDTNKDDIDSILAKGFVETDDGYENIYQYGEGEWSITVTEIIILGDENTGIQTTTIEKVKIEKGPYNYTNGIIIVDLGVNNFIKSLNLTSDTFVDEDNTLIIKYYVNGKYTNYAYVDNFNKVEDYLVNSPDSTIVNWYIDSNCTVLFDQHNFDAKEYKQNNEFLTLYAQKDYYNIFAFDGVEYKYDVNDYDGINTFADVEKKIFEKAGIEICTDNYTAVWTEGEKIVTSFSLPIGTNNLTSDHFYMLTLKPNDGYSCVNIIDSILHKRQIYFVETIQLDNTYLNDVLLDVIKILNEDFNKYNYSYLDNGEDCKNSTESLAFTQNHLLNNELVIFRTYCGITVTYVSRDTTDVDVIDISENYTINNFYGATTWYEVVDGELVEYTAGQEVNFTSSVTLYNSIFVVVCYGENNLLLQKLITPSESHEICFDTQEIIFDKYQFMGYKSKENMVFDKTKYSGSLRDFMLDFNVDLMGKTIISCVYQNETQTNPTKIEKGRIISEYYYGAEYIKEEKEIPILSPNNYEYTLVPATLFRNGLETFVSEKFGMYEIIIDKLSTYTFVYNEQTITICVENNDDCRLIINGEENNCSAIIDYENESITINVLEQGESTEYLYAASINIDNGIVDLLEIDGLEDINNDSLIASDVSDGKFYQYEKFDNYCIAMAEKVIYDSSYNVVFDSLEKYNEYYYVAQKNGASYNLSFVKSDNVYNVFVALSGNEAEFNLPQSNVDLGYDDFYMVTLHLQMDKNLTLNADGSFVYGDEQGNYYYDENNEIYVLYRNVLNNEKVFVYEIKNGEDIFYKTN